MARRSRAYAERAERAEVDDPQVVLEAAARFLETRSRSVDRGPAPADRRRATDPSWSTAPSRGCSTSASSTTRRSPGRGSSRATALGRAASGRSATSSGSRASTARRWTWSSRSVARPSLPSMTTASRRPPPDRTAAERLIRKHARALARVADPRQRRQRAYALLARNGFDPETCREVAAMVIATDIDAETSDRAGRMRRVARRRPRGRARARPRRVRRLHHRAGADHRAADVGTVGPRLAAGLHGRPAHGGPGPGGAVGDRHRQRRRDPLGGHLAAGLRRHDRRPGLRDERERAADRQGGRPRHPRRRRGRPQTWQTCGELTVLPEAS